MFFVQGNLTQSVQNFGNAEAIRMNNESFTYLQLDIKSNQIANLLISLGVTVGDCVGIYMGKCPEKVVSIFGVLKAGATYVPLNSGNPIERNSYIIAECKIEVLLTSSSHIEDIQSLVQRCNLPKKVVLTIPNSSPLQGKNNFDFNLMEYQQVVNQSKEALMHNMLSVQNIAAILYTSGSTGVPKGVMISHYNIDVFIKWALDRFSISQDDRLISHAPFYFDLSLFDIFVGIASGSCVVLVPDSKVNNPKYLTRIISEERITIWQSVPSALILMAEYGQWEGYDFKQVRHVLFAGERMAVKYLKTLFKHLTEAVFHNVYGCTETNNTFMYTVPNNPDELPDPLPIGKPLPYVTYRIVDQNNQDVSIRAQGELLINAATVMQGYRKDHKEKPGIAECDSINEVMPSYYHTHDIVVVLEDGTLHLCGRSDDIIKTNGFRVNLLELENCLQSHEKVLEVATFAIPDELIGNKIVASVCHKPQCSLSIVELRIFCSSKLSNYSIPHIMEVRSSSLPKTASGKINKKKLRSFFLSS